MNNLSNTVQTVVQTVTNAVTLTGNQRVRDVKDFADGVKIGGLPLYPINENTVFLDANIVFGGAATMFGKDSQRFGRTSPLIRTTLVGMARSGILKEVQAAEVEARTEASALQIWSITSRPTATPCRIG